MDSVPQIATAGAVFLDTIELNVRGAITRDIANTYGRRSAIGDPGPNDHPIHSTWTQENWSGGGQVRELNAATDTGRFWWSNCDTIHPGYIIPPPFTYSYLGPNTYVPVIIGDYTVAGKQWLYADWGGQLRRWDSEFDTWQDAPNDLTCVATGLGTQYRLKSGASAGQIWFFVPGGGNASVIKPDNTTAAITNGAVEFAVWDEKLFRLRANGAVEWCDDGGVTWTAVGQISDGSTPKHILEGWDRQGQAVLYVVTDSSLYVLDFDATKLRRSELKFPRHPDAGDAATQHMGEGMYVSVGMGIHRMIGDNVISDQGLDRRNGIPAEFKGRIKSLYSSYGLLFALVERTTTSVAVSGELQMYDTTQMLFDKSSGSSLVMVWNGQGWHYRWAWAGMSSSNIYVSNAGGEYRLWWGAGGRAFSQKLSRTYFNPSDVGDIETERYGDFYTGINNWGLPDQYKVAKVISIKTQGCDSLNFVDVYYIMGGLSGSNQQQYIGRITTNGLSRFYLGTDMTGGSPVYRGIKHQEIEIKLHLHSADGVLTNFPRVRRIIVAAKKIVRPQRTFRFVVDCTDNIEGITPDEFMAKLEDMVDVHESGQGEAIPFVVGDKLYMVDVVGLTFQEKPSLGKYFATISLIEALEMDVATPVINEQNGTVVEAGGTGLYYEAEI